MAGTVSDITQLKLIEEVLLESNALLEQKVNERTAELERANARLSQEMQQLVLAEQQRHQLQRELAVAEELQRRHIARELHDELGQLVVSLQLAIRNGASGAEDATIGSEYWPRLDALADEINQAAHRVARQLRPTALDDQGLIPALVDLLDEWSRQAMIEVDWEAATFHDAEFSLAVKSAIYRTVQEALTNVLKHARATRVSVVLERSAFGVTLIIEDNGAGFDPEWLSTISARRMGLRGMRERVELAGGSLEFESAPEGGGTTIFVRLPLEQLGSLGADN
jgi:signal transduction histidine kinase